jgi:hypothetical protein
MSNVNSQTTDIEWVVEVYDLLLEIARCGLSEMPKLPNNISQRALPLSQRAQEIREGSTSVNYSAWQHREREWVEQVSQFFIELTRISLAEQPRLPDNLAQRALTLADTAQSIKENFSDDTSVHDTPLDKPLGEPESFQSPDVLLNLLQDSLKTQREKSGYPDAPEWQQLLVLLDTIRGIYRRIN